MISVIIPTYNEQENIEDTIKMLWKFDEENLIKEIIIADGGSHDKTVSIAGRAAAKVVMCSDKGRAAQMNYGSSFASEEILFFIHADTIPPLHYGRDITKAIQEGFSAGCFRLTFDYKHWFLKANSWFTRFYVDAFRFGDQGLFVTRDAFLNTGGFSENHIVMEDQDLIKRIKRTFSFTIIKNPVITSARKYLENGIYKTQFVFFLIYVMYRLGFSQQKLVSTYKKCIVKHKL